MSSYPILFIGLVVFCAIVGLMICENLFANYMRTKGQKLEKGTNAIKNVDVKKKEDGMLKRQPPSTSYKELLGILNTTIEKELYFTVKLKFDFQDVKIIDFNENLQSISTHIIQALSQSYMDDLSYYHNEKWVMEYIVRTVRIYLTDYIKKHPVN